MFLNLRSVIYDVDDMDRAKAWYTRVLDNEPMIDGPEMVAFSVGGDRMVLHTAKHSTPANDTVSPVHDRMPAILDPEE